MMRLVMVGGGHAMLPALMQAGAWVQQGVEVTLIDAHRYLYYSGMVPEYLGSVYTQDEVRIDLEGLCRPRGVRFVQNPVAHLDPIGRVLTTANGSSVSYDVAAFDIGSRNPGIGGPAIQTKPLFHIEALAAYLDGVLNDPAASGQLAIVGGGAAGVEVALNVSARFASHGRSGDLSITIVEQSPRLLPGFPAGLSDDVTQHLTDRGVDVRCRATVASVHDEGVQLASGAVLPAGRVLWATGTTGQPLFSDAGLPVSERGFLRVTEALQCPSAPRIFAAGDCAVLEGHEGLTRVGVHAVKQGPILRDNLDRMLQALQTTERRPRPGDLRAFSPYPIAPLILSSGAPQGYWTAGPAWAKAALLLRLKHIVDRRWMRTYNEQWAGSSPADWIDAQAAQM